MDSEQSNSNLKLVPKFGFWVKSFLFITSVFCPLFIIIKRILFYSECTNLTSKREIYRCSQVYIYSSLMLMHMIIVLLMLNKKMFQVYCDNLKQIAMDRDFHTSKLIFRKRLIKNIVLISVLLFTYLLISLDDDIKSNPIALVSSVLNIHGHLFIIGIIIDQSINLQAAFKLINSKVDFLVNGQATVQSLKLCRLFYSHACEATESAEKYFGRYITYFYIQNACYNILNIVSALFNYPELNIFNFCYLLGDTILMVYLTYNLISVQRLSRKGLRSLYALTFKATSSEMKFENTLFIGQVLFTDIGFTFADLFTINIKFIASMLTLSLAIIVVLVNFLHQ